MFPCFQNSQCNLHAVFSPRTHIHCTQDIHSITGIHSAYYQKVTGFDKKFTTFNWNCKIQWNKGNIPAFGLFNIAIYIKVSSTYHRKYAFLSRRTQEFKNKKTSTEGGLTLHQAVQVYRTWCRVHMFSSSNMQSGCAAIRCFRRSVVFTIVKTQTQPTAQFNRVWG